MGVRHLRVPIKLNTLLSLLPTILNRKLQTKRGKGNIEEMKWLKKAGMFPPKKLSLKEGLR